MNAEQRAPAIHPVPGKRGERHRGRREGADAVRQRRSFEIPVQCRIGLLDPRGESGGVVVLRVRSDPPGGEPGQGLDQQVGAHGGQASEEITPCFGLSNFGFPLEQYRPGVETGVHEHGCHAGPAKAAGHGPDGRRGAAKFGEQGCVDIDGAEARHRKQSGGKDLAVVSDDDVVGREVRDRFPGAPAPDSFWLLYRYPEFQRQPLDPADARSMIPARGPIRLGNHGDDVVVRVKGPKHRFGKSGGPQEDHAEALHLRSSDPAAPGCRALPVAATHAATQFTNDEIALQDSEPIEKEAAVQVVHLVGERPRQQAVAFHLVDRTVETLAAHPYPRRPPGYAGISRNGQASFLLGLTPPRFENLRIGHDDQFPLLFADRNVNHHQTHTHSDLGRGEANPGRGVHGRHHVVHQFLPVLIEVLNGFGRGGQGGSPVTQDRTDRQTAGDCSLGSAPRRLDSYTPGIVMDRHSEARSPHPAIAPETRFEARIAGMHCAGCVASIEKAVVGLPGVESAEVSLLTGDLSVRLSGAGAPDAAVTADIAGAVESAGPYRLEPAEESPTEQRERAGETERSSHWSSGLLPVVFALALSAAAMTVAMSGFGGTTAGRWVQFVLATPVCVLLGRDFLAALGKSLRHRTFGMDSLIGLGAGAAYVSSVVTLVGAAGGPLFFDTAAIIVAIVRLGRWLEDRARGRAADALGELLAFAPDQARVVRRGVEQMVPVAGVQLGERVRVRPGERVPLDGRIVRGGAAMDESLVTGESVPVERAVPDPVVAGAMNLTGAVEVEVTRVASESTLSRIAASVRKAQTEKIPIQRIADRVAGVFVPIVMVAAVLTVGGWLVYGDGMDFALARGVAVLVVACPCAVGLAAPIAVLVATGRSARRGILFRSGGALEALASVRAVGLDKTGTVTTGDPVVVAVEPAPGRNAEDLLRFAASAEQGSEHPLGKALIAHAELKGLALQTPERFEALPGRGVTAKFGGGTTVWVGSDRLVREHGLPIPASPGEDGASGRLRVLREAAGRLELVGSIGFRDRPRPEAAELVRRLDDDGLAVSLLSGDEPAAVAATGSEIGVRNVEGGLLPGQKLSAVDRLRDRYGPVAMVGDGINDAPALARADVGVAFAEGTEIAREAAAVTLMRPDLRLVSEALRIARRALRTIRQNLFWAFFYNVAAVPLAAGVLYPSTGLLLPPEAAAAAMALSSLTVVGNALRLKAGD